MVDNDFTTQDRNHGIPLATETFPDAVVGIGVEIVQGQGLVEIGINEHEIRVTAGGNDAFLRVEPKDFCGIGGGDRGKALQRHVALRHKFGKCYWQACLNTVMAATHSLDSVAG